MTNEEFIKSISEEGEEWRDVVGFEGQYKVSNFGNVITLDRSYQNNIGAIRIIPKKLKPWVKTTGYTEVFLCKNGVRKHCKIHRLVAEAFIENPNNYPHVDHIDTNRTNNHVSNLRWVTRGMNQMNPLTRKHISDSHIGLLSGRPSAKRIPIVQLFDNKVIKTYECIRDVKNFGFNNVSVIRCCKNKQKEHGGYQWMYKSDYDQLVNTEQS